MTQQPGLFDLPEPPQPPPATTATGRGRRRETWARRVVADLHVVDPAALRAAALHRFDTAVTIDLGPAADTDDPDLVDPRDEIATDSAAAAQWWIEPTQGLWPQLAESLRVDAVDLDGTGTGPNQVRLSWAVTVRILDPDALRAAAARAAGTDPAARTEIETSFAAAWNHAADPWAPLDGLPGITWTPGSVEVVHCTVR